MSTYNIDYVLGLDIGIGSIGWAVVNLNPKRIEDFGVRIFDTGENTKDKERSSQERRQYRGNRRLTRRKHQRKERLKNYLKINGINDMRTYQAFSEDGKNNVLDIRVRGLDEALSPDELTLALLNICKRRGYKDFYDVDINELSVDEKKEAEAEIAATQAFSKIYSSGKYRSVGEMFKNAPEFADGYRNRKFREETVLVPRDELKKEAIAILEKQAEFNNKITDKVINDIIGIIFAQRTFEEGPGNPEDETRIYKGFDYLDSIGKCSIYKDEDRACRATCIADIYSLINAVSTLVFADNGTGEIGLNTAFAKDLIRTVAMDGEINKNDFKKLVKKHRLTIVNENALKNIDFPKNFKYMRYIKKVLEENGYDWCNYIGYDTEDYLDVNSNINKLGLLLSKYVTPVKRISEIKAEKILDDKTVEKLARIKFGGTANVCDKFMLGAIDAFKEGEVYGAYQARINKEIANEEKIGENLSVKLPQFKKDFEFYKNPVVFRAINETRKVINAIIERYGSPSAVNIEVAKEVNKSFKDRDAEDKRAKENRRNRDNAIKAIAELLGISEAEVKPVMVDKYMLGELQNWKCLYSGRDIDKEACLKRDRDYEVDHIIPFSLILDNTLNNKALVYGSENQYKGQRSPLMYLTGEKREEFKKRVNVLFNKKIINANKYNYLMTENIYDSGVLGEWKSRNINDTRYISKFIVNYIRNNLYIKDSEYLGQESRKVYAVKAQITSQMRRKWLNEKTWGMPDKDVLKSVTYLDHAVDAIVIANCIPGYVEIAMLNNRLNQIYRKSGKTYSDEYKSVLKNAIENIHRYYGIDTKEAERLLRFRDKTPCLTNDLYTEVEKRVDDVDVHNYFNIRDGRESMTKKEFEAFFRKSIRDYYMSDPEFAERVRIPQTSFKIVKKYKGAMTSDNAMSLKPYIDEEGNERLVAVDNVSIEKLKPEQLNNICSQDKNLIADLKQLFEANSKCATFGDVMKAEGITAYYGPNGNIVRSLKVKNPSKNTNTVYKEIDENNHAYLPNGGYYCVEFYKTKDSLLGLRGVPYHELRKVNGEFVNSPTAKLPDDYASHITYLNRYEYFEIIDKNGDVKERSGFFVGVANINQMKFDTTRNNTPNVHMIFMKNDKTIMIEEKKIREVLSVSARDSIKKYIYDILGYRTGEIKCGEQ